jgi:pyruvate/2-oxoglutarate dehydrogenase complex dihydrolipoamide acyltransferase (E2) component
MRQFLLPDLGIGNKDAEVVAWHVAEGDHVGADRPLVSVETDKATVELPSPYNGRIVRLLANPGDLVKVGEPLVEFAEGAEDAPGPVVSRPTVTARNVRQPASSPAAHGTRSARHQFLLPDLGIGEKDTEIIAWHVSEGDHVEADDPLLSVETDKATVELPSPWTGRVDRLLVGTGELVKVGTPLVEVVEGGGDAGYYAGAEPEPVREARPVREPAPQPVRQRERASEPAPTRILPRKAQPLPEPEAPEPEVEEEVPQRPAPPPRREPVPAPAPPRQAAAPSPQASQALTRDLPAEVNSVSVHANDYGSTMTPAEADAAARDLAEEEARWSGEVKELPAEGSHLPIALAVIVVVLLGLFVAWWLDPLG